MSERTKRIIAIFLAINLFFDTLYPTAAMALTGGPSQPEVQAFTPIGTSDMVNLFSGDYNYNIPLLDVDGYPINLSYNSGVGTDQEASWVGLGWNINAGTINRNMRSLPDDFKGDEIKKEFNMKPNQTFAFNFSPGAELFGIDLKKLTDKLKLNLGINYNTYNGYGVDIGADIRIAGASGNKDGMTASLGLSAGTEKGLGISPSVSFSKKSTKYKNAELVGHKASGTLGLGFNSRTGLQQLTIKASYEKTSVKFFDFMGMMIPVGVKKNNMNGGGSISFASPTYVPQVGTSMVNMGFGVQFSFGAEAVGAHPKASFGGSYSGQFVKDREKTHYGYGYINTQSGDAADSKENMLDFNREKDGSFTLNTPNLPVTNFAYDVLAVSGQGIGGAYRPYRNDVGTLHDPKVTNFPEINADVGIEFGAGNTAHVGVNVSLTESDSHSGMWKQGNKASGTFSFRSKNAGDPLYENVYYKQVGEKTAETDKNYFNDVINGFDPVRLDLQVAGAQAYVLNDVVLGLGQSGPKKTVSNNGKFTRARRNEVISTMNADDAVNYALIKDIQDYSMGVFTMFDGGGGINTIGRTSGSYQNHHISQVSAVRADGARYVYGIPAYNYLQKEATFAVEPTAPLSCSSGPIFPGSNVNYNLGTVTYNAGNDNSKDNNLANDHYFNRTTLPAYAHSYLLTAVLSADYVDKTGDGPSPDDLGTYTKVNYSRAQNTTNTSYKYKWRTPFTANTANLNEGLKSVKGIAGDDKANYVYGEKEVWYTHSIESKNFVALFHLLDRNDSRGVQGEDGGIDNSFKLKKLDKIELYNKKDILVNGLAGATPLKVVHFDYDYSLCPGIENNSVGGAGKLTLKKVWFTYQGSLKGQLSPYEFTYGYNPAYNMKAYDGWGNYKPNLAACNYDATSLTDISPTSEFPYTEQPNVTGANNADIYAQAWHLTNVKLPSGGEIKVTYESDDYAYVQNRRAMQMFTVSGAASDNAGTNFGNKLYENNYNNNLFFYIPLTATLVAQINSSASPDDEVRRLFFQDENGKDMTYVYFRSLMDIERNISLYSPKYEYITGYARVDYSSAPKLDAANNRIIFKVRQEPVFDNIDLPGVNINPLAMAGINFTRAYIPHVAYDNYQDPTAGPLNLMSILGALKGVISSVTQFFKGGVSNALRLSWASQLFIPKRTFFRLYNPTFNKKGGGSRVKQIELADNWKNLTGQSSYTNETYGQVYSYTTKDEKGRTISSGVATFEPVVSGDENPWRQPKFYKEKHILAPDDDYYLEEPFGECFFPAASVGYSRVLVKNLQRTNVSRHGTGAVVHEFYTAKEFPTKATFTGLKKERHKPNPVFKFLKLFSRDFMTASQGYQIVLNDMHGKPKAQYVYKEADASLTPAQKDDSYSGNGFISGIEYKYKRVNDKLDNAVDVVNKKGEIENNYVGLDYDMIVDMRESQSVTRTGALHGNLEGFFIAIFPGLVPTVFPGYGQEKTRFRSSVVTKVINMYGLLEETVAYDDGSRVSTKNKLWDAETGEVILTETVNNFDDPLFNMNYPSHWAYDRMGGAYKNIDAAGIITAGNIIDPQDMVIGDEVILYSTSSSIKGWVKKISPMDIIDASGNSIGLSSYNLYKVIRSGRRNLQSLPVGKIVSLANPIVTVGSNKSIDVSKNTKILSAVAAEFSDDWGVFCECGITQGGKYNTFLIGQKGNFRPSASYVYLTGREQSKQNSNTNIRKDGVYTNYIPFWTPNTGSSPFDWNKTTSPEWQFTNKMTIYSPYGFELENIDALGRNSSAIYSYGNTLPIAVSSNAKYRQVGYDGFEDYDYRNPCEDNHFSYLDNTYNRLTNNYVTQVTPNNPNYQKYSHTGKKSLLLKMGQSKNLHIGNVSTGPGGCGAPPIMYK